MFRPVKMLLSAGLVACAVPSVAAASANIQPGQWEITSRVQPPKLPFGLSIPPNSVIPQSAVYTKCITLEDIDRPQAFVQQQTGCNVTSLQMGDATATWAASCSQPAPSRSSGEATFNGATAEGHSTLITNVQGFELPVQIHFRGRRIGSCPP